jgi:hypothetical protein
VKRDENDLLRAGELGFDPFDGAVALDPPPHASASTRVEPWPDPASPEAYHGLAGEIVRVIEPHSEADPIAILAQLLVAVGNAIGRTPYFQAGADRHHLNLFLTLVGATAKGRKGSSWGEVARICGLADHEWTETRVLSGSTSGEGLIWAVRDPILKREAVREKKEIKRYVDVVEDEGVRDKRLLVLESEFARQLKTIDREGNTLSAVIRCAWDNGTLRTLTKNSPATATGAHISIVAHITKEELLRHLARTEAANGFGNRFLWLCVRRSKFLPDGGALADADLAPHAARLTEALMAARRVQRMERDDAARALWHEVYRPLSEGSPGLLGAMTGRAEAQVMRLACLYALLDLSPMIRVEHLRAALALWRYSEASARFVFGARLGDPTADAILAALRAAENGLTRTEIHHALSRNASAHEIDRALAALVGHGLARSETEGGPLGRTVERWRALGAPGPTNSTNPTKSGAADPALGSSNSSNSSPLDALKDATAWREE